MGTFATACGSGGEPSKDGGHSGPVTITFWHSETASGADNLVKLVDRFNASQDEVKVEPVYQGGDQDLALKLIASMPSGSVPTIAYNSEPFTQSMIDSGQVTPIQEYVDRDKYDLSDFSPAAIAYYTVDNTLYAMPFGLAVPLMYYDRAPFREVGLVTQTTHPRTWTRLLRRQRSFSSATRPATSPAPASLWMPPPGT